MTSNITPDQIRPGDLLFFLYRDGLRRAAYAVERATKTENGWAMKVTLLGGVRMTIASKDLAALVRA